MLKMAVGNSDSFDPAAAVAETLDQCRERLDGMDPQAARRTDRPPCGQCRPVQRTVHQTSQRGGYVARHRRLSDTAMGAPR
jgi:hypothetical protein